MGTCSQPGYVFRDFCLEQGIDYIIFCLHQGIDLVNFCLKLDCLQSAFSLKLRPDETKKESLCTDVAPPSENKKCLLFFLLGLTPSFLATSGLAARVLRFRVQ